jgi:haloalkane dehalogenase
METLRTPDDRFARLPGYPFAPHYVDVSGLRVHYVDEGPRSAPPVLLLHGEPSWSYLYRKMIPVLTAAGHRAVAPDLVGFGRSDKPVRREDYTYQRHVDWMRGVVEALDLRGVTLVCQDWGGLIGLRLVAEHPADVIAAYDAPFPDDRHKAGARQFPLLVPNTPDDPAAVPNRRAWEELRRWRKPFLTAFSDSDPVTQGADRLLREAIPGAAGQLHTTIVGGGHFLQEDRGEEIAARIARFVVA